MVPHGARPAHPWNSSCIGPSRARREAHEEKERAAMSKLADSIEADDANASPDPAFERVVVGGISDVAFRRTERNFTNEP
jgi:hypothetical protein